MKKLDPQLKDNMVYNQASTAFVVGNGPSLTNFDFSQLTAHHWVGMNAAYRHWERCNIYPTYYACLDLLVGLSHEKAIIDMVSRAEELQIKSFLLRDNLISRSDILQDSSYVVNYDKCFKSIPNRVLELVTTGSHSTVWMHSLGYKQIILLGIDVNYIEHVKGSQVILEDGEQYKLKVTQKKPNENYFFEDYQRVNDIYTVPNPVPDLHKAAWRRAVVYIEGHKACSQIYNGSDISKLNCLDFISASDFLSNGMAKIEPLSKRIEKWSKNGQEMSDSAFSIAKGNLTYSALSHFLEVLLPIQYSPILVHETLNHIVFPGWSQQQLNFDKITMFSGSCISSKTYLLHSTRIAGSGFVVIPVDEGVDLDHLISRLFIDFDAIYSLQSIGNTVHLLQYPSLKTTKPAFIIAFARQRFWPPVIVRAFQSVMLTAEEERNIFYKNGLLKRRLRFYLKSLKTKLKGYTL